MQIQLGGFGLPSAQQNVSVVSIDTSFGISENEKKKVFT